MRARPSAEIRVVEVQKLRTLYDFCGARTTLRGDSRGRGSKTEDFLRFLRAACGDSRGRGSKTEAFYDFCGPRATLCGDRARRSALAVAPCKFVLVSANPLRRLCVSKRSRCGAVRICCWRNGHWKLSRGSRACFRIPAVAGSIPPWSAAAPA